MKTYCKIGVICIILTSWQTNASEALLAEAAKQHKLPITLLRAIASVESNNNPLAVNRKTHDYGLMQVNIKTAQGFGYKPADLMHAPTNVAVAAKLLKQYKRRFGHEKTWACRYNLGTARNVSQWNSCKNYLDKLFKAGYSLESNK